MTTREILLRTRSAMACLQAMDEAGKNAMLLAMADRLQEHRTDILRENAADMEAARGHLSEGMLDRLLLNNGRIDAMAAGIRALTALPDHTGRTLSEVIRPNGMVIRKVQIPLGLIAIIYESRPNVTSDAAALALKSGNVCVLRSGKESIRSAAAIVLTRRC